MDQIIRSGLAKRGWAQHELDRFERINLPNPPLRNRIFDSLVYWSILAVSIFANFIASIVLIPILLVITKSFIIIALFFVGLVFGVLLETILKETGRYSQSRLLIPELFIPTVALINIYIATKISNDVAGMLLLFDSVQNPFVTSIVYVTAFMLPHFWRKYHSHKNILTI